MAKFEEVLPALREGKKIRQPGVYGQTIKFPACISHSDAMCVYSRDGYHYHATALSLISILADDWEIVDSLPAAEREAERQE